MRWQVLQLKIPNVLASLTGKVFLSHALSKFLHAVLYGPRTPRILDEDAPLFCTPKTHQELSALKLLSFFILFNNDLSPHYPSIYDKLLIIAGLAA